MSVEGKAVRLPFKFTLRFLLLFFLDPIEDPLRPSLDLLARRPRAFVCSVNESLWVDLLMTLLSLRTVMLRIRPSLPARNVVTYSSMCSRMASRWTGRLIVVPFEVLNVTDRM